MLATISFITALGNSNINLPFKPNLIDTCAQTIQSSTGEYQKGALLAKITVPVGGKGVPLGVRLERAKLYILLVEGTVSSEQGRAEDAFYLYQDPFNTEGLPRRASPLSVFEANDRVNRDLPYYRASGAKWPGYNPSHQYEVLLEPEKNADYFVAVPKSYWDWPHDRPKDHIITGSFTLTLYDAIKAGEGAQFELLDAQLARGENGLGVQFPLEGTPSTAKYDWLATMRPSVTLAGAATDGASLVLLRVAAPSKGKVEFKLSTSDGALYPLIGNPFRSARAGSVEVRTIALHVSNGAGGEGAIPTRHFAFALYRPPSYPCKFLEAPLSFSYNFKPEDSSKSSLSDQKTIKLVRPPVVLVHGTYDTPKECWQTRNDADEALDTMEDFLRKQGYGAIWCVDWEKTNGRYDPSAFVDNELTVLKNKNGISDALNTMRKLGFAVTQADLVCHSQGGVISRVFARGYTLLIPMNANHTHFSDPWACMRTNCHYHAAENFGVGYIHRLITISSTHMGSDICRLFNSYEKYSAELGGAKGLWLSIFLGYVQAFESGVKTGGFRDQIPGSEGLRQIGPTPVPSHAIACVSNDHDLENQYSGFYFERLKTIWRATPVKSLAICMRDLGQPDDALKLQTLYELPDYSALSNNGLRKALLAFREAVFAHEENDCTVRISSSFGGLKDPCRTRIQGVLHGWAPRYSSVQTRVLELLLDDGKQFDPNGFPDAYKGTRTTASNFVVNLNWSQETATGSRPGLVMPAITTATSTTSSRSTNTVSLEAQRLWDNANKKWTSGDYSGAEGTLREAVALSPTNAALQSAYAGMLFYLGKFSEAETHSKEAVRLEPASASFRTGHGYSLLYLARYTEAESEFREAIRLKPTAADAHAGLGNTLQSLGKHVEAEKSFREAVKLLPQIPDYHAFVGNSLCYQNKWDEAVPFYEQALRLNPNLAVAHAGIGGVHFVKGRYQDAEKALRTAVKLDPRQGLYHVNLAGVLYLLNKHDEAKQEALEAKRLGIDVKSHWIFEKLGIF